MHREKVGLMSIHDFVLRIHALDAHYDAKHTMLSRVKTWALWTYIHDHYNHLPSPETYPSSSGESACHRYLAPTLMMLATLAHQHNYHPCAMHQQCIITLNCTFLQLHWTGSCCVPSPYPTITPHLLKLYWPGCRLSPPSSLMIFSMAVVSFPRTNRTKATVWNFHLA